MLAKPIRHLLKSEPHVLKAYLLGNHEHRHGGESLMDIAHQARKYRGITHACIEQPDGRRARANH